MEDCLKTGEELGPRFAEIAQVMAQTTPKAFEHEKVYGAM